MSGISTNIEEDRHSNLDSIRRGHEISFLNVDETFDKALSSILQKTRRKYFIN